MQKQGQNHSPQSLCWHVEEQSFEIPVPLPYSQEDWEGTVEDLESDSLSSNCAGRIRNARWRAWGDRGGRDTGTRSWDTVWQSLHTEKGWRCSLRGQLSKWILCYGAGAPNRQRERELKEQRQEDKGAKNVTERVGQCGNQQGRKMWTPLSAVIFVKHEQSFVRGSPTTTRFRASG